MKIIVALDSFKGSMTSNELNQIVENRLRRELDHPNIIKIPISDGGEGFLESYSTLSSYETIYVKAHDPIMRLIDTKYMFNDDKGIAVIESAEIIGLDKVEKLSPLDSTSYGLGEVIKDAIDRGAKEVIVGLGGSATNDAGIGMLKALGFEFFDKNKNMIDITISNMDKVTDFQLNNKYLKEISFKSVTDVKNIFTGSKGASRVFGPQKGLKENQINYVEKKFKSLNEFLKTEFTIDLNSIEGTGAAGGISGVMKAFLNGEILSGIEYILKEVKFDEHCKDTDMIITGEGKIDHQSFFGKVIEGISDKAEHYNIPVIALGGSVDINSLNINDQTYPNVFSIINTPITLQDAMKKETTVQNLDFTVKNICKILKLK